MFKSSIKTIKINNLIESIYISFLAINAVIEVWLAFASDPAMSIFIKIDTYGCVVLTIIYYSMIKRKTKKSDIVYLIVPGVFLLMLILHTYGGYNLYWITTFISVCGFLLLSSQLKAKAFLIFFRIIIVFNFISLFVYLSYITGIGLPFQRVNFFDENINSVVYYNRWSIFAVVSAGKWDRLCGIFNEAGALGTVSGLLLATTWNHSSVFEKIILLLSIFCSFSLAGYLLAVISFALLLLKKNWKFSVILIAIVAFINIIPSIDWHNDNLNILASRISFSQFILGGNRTDALFDQVFNDFLRTGNTIFGNGYGYSILNSDYSTYKIYILMFGFVGLALLLFLWIYFPIRASKGNKTCYIVVVVLICALYQRPFIICSMYGYLYVYGSIEFIKEHELLSTVQNKDNSKQLKRRIFKNKNVNDNAFL